MSSMGEKMPKKELDAMVKEADKDNDGLINCQGKIIFLYFIIASANMVAFTSLAAQALHW